MFFRSKLVTLRPNMRFSLRSLLRFSCALICLEFCAKIRNFDNIHINFANILNKINKK